MSSSFAPAFRQKTLTKVDSPKSPSGQPPLSGEPHREGQGTGAPDWDDLYDRAKRFGHNFAWLRETASTQATPVADGAPIQLKGGKGGGKEKRKTYKNERQEAARHKRLDPLVDAFEQGRLEQGRERVSGINSILEQGILTRDELERRSLAYTKSSDQGGGTRNAVHLNALAAGNKSDAGKIAKNSLYQSSQGSLSVALERWNDPLLKEFSKIENISKKDRKTYERALSTKLQQSGEHATSLEGFLKKEALAETFGQSSKVQQEMSERASRSVLALLDPEELFNQAPDLDSMTDALRIQTMESPGLREETFRSSVAPKSISRLLIPESYKKDSEFIENPYKVKLQFVPETRKMEAHYYNEGTGPLHNRHLPVNFRGPDYETPLTQELQKKKQLATHLMKL